ncbi:4736_t:CDS:2, partial [Scutellospora calospora]
MVEIPRVPFCCFVVPLRIGAFIVAAWMLIWFAYLGVVSMLAAYGTSIIYTIIWKFFGACYLLLAAGAFYGAHGIYHEIPHRVAKFVRFYFIAYIFYIVAEIVFVIVVEIAVAATIANAKATAKANCEKAMQNSPSLPANYCDNIYNNVNANAGYSIIGWIIPFVIGLVWQ